jgi:hypothetical protein
MTIVAEPAHPLLVLSVSHATLKVMQSDTSFLLVLPPATKAWELRILWANLSRRGAKQIKSWWGNWEHDFPSFHSSQRRRRFPIPCDENIQFPNEATRGAPPIRMYVNTTATVITKLIVR